MRGFIGDLVIFFAVCYTAWKCIIKPLAASYAAEAKRKLEEEAKKKDAVRDAEIAAMKKAMEDLTKRLDGEPQKTP